MSESAQIEVGGELRIHAQQQVLVEGRGQPERIVIGELQVAFGLDQIGAEQQVIARPNRRAHEAKERGRARWVEVPDVGAEERQERRVCVIGRQREQPVFVGGLMGGHTQVQVFDGAERPHRLPERGGGQVDQVRVRPAGIRMRQQRRELLAVPASELDDSPALPECLPDRDRVPLKQLQLGSRDAVPRQVTDRVEQGRAKRVVQESRRQLPRFQLQVETSRLRELAPVVADAWWSAGRSRRDRSILQMTCVASSHYSVDLTQRNVA